MNGDSTMPSNCEEHNSDNDGRNEINDGRKDLLGGHGGVVEEEVGGEDGVASDRWLRLEIFFFCLA